eukprot:3358777-Pleurochrysis_carterae.AAC.1
MAYQSQLKVPKCDVTAFLPRKRVNRPAVYDRPVARSPRYLVPGQVLGKVPEQNREKPSEAGSCTGASHIPFLGVGTCSSSISPTGSSNAVNHNLVGDAADGTPTMPGIYR